MIREFVGAELVPPEKHFRWRGGEITRQEGFTDAVFVLAVTLLIVSPEVPKTVSQLAVTMNGFLAFTVCFGLVAHIGTTTSRGESPPGSCRPRFRCWRRSS